MVGRLRSLFRAAGGAVVGPPFRYPEARHGGGALTYRNDLPVLQVAGAPEQVGEQLAVLGLRPASRLLDYPTDLLRLFFRSRALTRLLLRRVVRIGEKLLAHFAEAPRREFDGVVRAGLDRDRVLAANTLLDMKNLSLGQLFGCSSLILPAEVCATGGPLFGRNLDFFTLGYLHAYSLVTVYPAGVGRRAFASAGFPGFLGCFSGMNDAGLALASHEVLAPPGPRRFNPGGMPFALAYRRVLEECATTGEALGLLRGIERTTSTMLVLCDRAGGAVLEVTPDHVVPRPWEGNVVTCTNHFCSPELARRHPLRRFRTAERLQTLRQLTAEPRPYDLGDVQAALHAVHQGELTLQTMVFEPAALRLHVALGGGPSTALDLKTLELAALFGGSRA